MTQYSNEQNQYYRNMNNEEYELHYEELTRKRQEHEIKILGDMEREIRNKLTMLEDSIKRMSKKKKMKEISHQRSISNPEETTEVVSEMKKSFELEQVKTKSSEDLVKKINNANTLIENKAILRTSRSYDNRRHNRVHVPIVPETRRRRTATPENYLTETKPQYSPPLSRPRANAYVECPIIQRPQTSSAMYSTSAPTTVERTSYSRQQSQVQPSTVVKAHSAGVATKYREVEKENISTTNRFTPASNGALYAKKKSLNAAVPRDQSRWQHNIDTQPARSSSAFGMYKTNIGVSNTIVGNKNSLPRARNEPVRIRQVETKRRFPGYLEQEERYHSVENLIEKRPLAKTNSTILNSKDFQIISLESRTVAQQIKLKELEKRYFNQNRILTKTEWASFVSKFSETQKEVRNLDNEWQELFSELISQNSEYNDHLNKIRMWVTALKADSKFLQEIMAQNLVTPM